MTGREQIVELLRNGVSHGNTRRPCLALAPIATVTHSGFRTLVEEHGGCDLYWTEMTSSEALINGTPFESCYLDPRPDAGRTIFQLVGYAPDPICDAADLVSGLGFAGIDINLSCSAPHIVRKGGGIAWMRQPDEALSMIAMVRRRVPNGTLSLKLRLGMSKADDLAAFCRRAVDAGVDFVTLHPKLQKEGIARPARWSATAELREQLSVPVVGSGGIVGWDTLHERLRAAGNGPVMIGRGAIRAPWLFAYLDGRFRDGGYTHEVDLKVVLNRFHALLEARQPREFHASRARRFYPYFFQNFRFGGRVGARLARCDEYSLARAEADQYVEDHAVECLVTERR